MQGIERLAKSRSGTEKTDLSREFLYLNYAGKGQRVLQRYGADNFARLRQTARKWDPGQHLQRLWRGYFQLQDAARRPGRRGSWRGVGAFQGRAVRTGRCSTGLNGGPGATCRGFTDVGTVRHLVGFCLKRNVGPVTLLVFA